MTVPIFQGSHVTLYNGDALETLRTLPDGSVDCCVTSPPYWGLRDYGEDGQMGLESTPEEYVAGMVRVFAEVRRVLSDDGTLWLNLGDSYANNFGTCNAGASATVGATVSGVQTARNRVPAGLKPKDLVGIPWRVAFALQADGWYLRSDIIWAKPNPMPESVQDRPTKAHEYVFLLSKSQRYHYDADAIREPHSDVSLARAKRNRGGGKYIGADPREHGSIKMGANYGESGDIDKICSPGGRNKRSVWTIATKPYREAHFATFPRELPELCIKAGCPEGGTVLDPFGGAGTTAWVAKELGRRSVTIELNPDYCDMIARRCAQGVLGI